MALSAHELELFAKSTANVVRSIVDPLNKELADLRAQIASIPAGEKGDTGERGEPGRNGKDADPDSIAEVVLGDVRPWIVEHITKQVANIPAPKDGANGKDGLDGLDGKNGENGRDGVDGAPGPKGEPGDIGPQGKSLTVDDIRPLIDAEIAKGLLELERRSQVVLDRAIDRIPQSIEAKEIEVSEEMLERAVSSHLKANPIPAGKDGVDGKHGKDGKPGLDGRDGIDGKDGVPGKDGVDGINGKDGAPGKDGADGTDGADGRDGATVEELMPALEALYAKGALEWEKRSQDLVHRYLERLPQSSDILAALKADLDGMLSTLRDEVLQTVEKWPKPRGFKYQEIWKPEAEYQPGDFVTWDGSMWACLEACKDSKPGQYNAKHWRLAVKRGRNGKSAE